MLKSKAHSTPQDSKLSEFELIAQYFTPLAKPDAANIDIGIGDDCAVFCLEDNERLAVSVDTLVAGIHFPVQAKPGQIATRAIAVSVSDLAAMGARPVAITLALTVPENHARWFAEFAQGLAYSLEQYSVPLVGGDTTRGAVSITVQVMGALPKNLALTRAGAKAGDLVFVSGYLGDGAAALASMSDGQINGDYFENRFYQPQARIELGQKLLVLASAAIDISDGLLADAGHIAKASSVAINIEQEKLPISRAAAEFGDKTQQLQWALAGGDDYELCFCVPAEKKTEVKALADKLGLPLTEIGYVEQGLGVQCLDGAGQKVTFDKGGYQHFDTDTEVPIKNGGIV